MGLFDRNKKIEGKTAEEWYDLGENEKDLIKEVEYYLKCVELDPKNAIAWYNIGLGFYILQRYEEAIRCCDKALEIDPEDANALYIKGLTLYNLGRNEEAIRCCDKALEIDPSYINAKKGKKTVEEKLKGKNSSKKPVASIKKTIRKPSPSSKSTTQDTIGGKTASEWENEGETLRKSGIYEETIRWFDKVLEIDPGDDDAWTQKGLALRNLEQYDEAIRWFDKVLEIDPGDDDAWTQKGLALRNLEQYDEAIRCYDKALEIDPKEAFAWSNKGFALSELERFEEAIRCYDKALEIDPKEAFAWNNKGNALHNLERYEEAIRCFDKALEIDPKSAPAWNGKGLALNNLEHYEEAIRCFDKALKIDPNHFDAKDAKIFTEGRERALKLKQKKLHDAHVKTESLINSIESEIKKIKDSGVRIPKSEELIEQAKKENDSNNSTKAEELASEAKRIASEIRSRYDTASNSISVAEKNLREASKDGLIIPDSLLNRSKVVFDNGDYNESIKLSNDLKKLIEATKVQNKNAKESLQSAESAVKIAEEFGCETSKFVQILNEAELKFKDGDYEGALSDARRTEKSAKWEKENSKPDLELDLPIKSFKPNHWEETNLIVKNKGTAHARGVKVTFSKEVEVKRTRNFDLDTNEETELTFLLKPVDQGKVPLDLTISYSDSEGKEYSSEKSFMINVGLEEQEEKPKSPAEFTPKPTTPKTFPPELEEIYYDAEIIGRGGFARVFKARRRSDKEIVAVKVPISLDASTGKTFVREVENWTKLNHDNIVKVYDYNVLPLPYFEMELCDCSLNDIPKPFL